MQIFDEIERLDDHGSEYGEGKFAYLNRSGRTAVGSVREKINEWVANYPEHHQTPLVARIRSDNDVTHESALFELLLHEALLRSGVTVEAIEPQLTHTDRSPDFLIRLATGERMYLEATLTTGISDSDRRAKRLLDAAIQAVDSVRSDDFALEARFTGVPTRPIRLRRVRTAVQQWLAGLDYEDTKRLWDSSAHRRKRPQWDYNEDGLSISLWPIPRNNRVAIGRGIGLQHGGGWSRTPGAALRQSIEKKAVRYGELDLPFIVAVNGLDHHGDEYDILAALLGNEVVSFRVGGDAADATTDRTWDGAWISPDHRPRNQRVSAVLVFDGLALWTPKKRGLLVLNPWADRPVTTPPLDVDRLLPFEAGFRREEGRSYGEMVGIGNNWPTDD